jgi:hypothetical protein
VILKYTNNILLGQAPNRRFEIISTPIISNPGSQVIEFDPFSEISREING